MTIIMVLLSGLELVEVSSTIEYHIKASKNNYESMRLQNKNKNGPPQTQHQSAQI